MTQSSATNRKSIREAEKAAAEFESYRTNFLAAAMSTPAGRLYFHDLLTFCQCFVVAPTFETNRDYLALGLRNVGMRIFADIMTHCPGQFTQMQQEANDRDHILSVRQSDPPGTRRDDSGSVVDSAHDFYSDPDEPGLPFDE